MLRMDVNVFDETKEGDAAGRQGTTTQSAPSTTTTVTSAADVARRPAQHVPLRVSYGGLVPTAASQALLHDIGGLERLVQMTYIFYVKFWDDAHLRQFLGNLHTPLEEHARRIAMYMAEMMGSDGAPWTTDTETRPKVPVPIAGHRTVVVNSRMSAHQCAWHSVTREPSRVGRRFKLEDCRVWMRLMFWACRESGLADHAVFFSYFTRWVGHFIPIYENTATVFVRAEARWSESKANTAQYVADGRIMRDVVGVPHAVALRSIPAAEATDATWPYGDNTF